MLAPGERRLEHDVQQQASTSYDSPHSAYGATVICDRSRVRER
ncbi:hypothetical protein ACFMBG_22030 [Leisingera sp. D0M16]